MDKKKILAIIKIVEGDNLDDIKKLFAATLKILKSTAEIDFDAAKSLAGGDGDV